MKKTLKNKLLKFLVRVICTLCTGGCCKRKDYEKNGDA